MPGITKYFILIGLLILEAGCEVKRKAVFENQIDPSEWALLPFNRIDSINPVLLPSNTLTFMDPILNQSVLWEEKDVFNPAAVVKDGRVYLLYRAEDNIGIYKGTSRIGLAFSFDGLHFKKNPEPVFYPSEDSMKIYEWPGGCEDPRVVMSEDNQYIMTYTAWEGKTARLCVAVSKDLMHWEKKGLAFSKAYYGKLYYFRYNLSSKILISQIQIKFPSINIQYNLLKNKVFTLFTVKHISVK